MRSPGLYGNIINHFMDSPSMVNEEWLITMMMTTTMMMMMTTIIKIIITTIIITTPVNDRFRSLSMANG